MNTEACLGSYGVIITTAGIADGKSECQHCHQRVAIIPAGSGTRFTRRAEPVQDWHAVPATGRELLASMCLSCELFDCAGCEQWQAMPELGCCCGTYRPEEPDYDDDDFESSGVSAVTK